MGARTRVWYMVFTVESGNARAKFRNAIDAVEYITNKPDLDIRVEHEESQDQS